MDNNDDNNDDKYDEQTNPDGILNRVFFSKYVCIKKLGEGSFGMIYKAEYNKEYYALKLENRKKGQNLLENEAAIMSYLKGPNIPYIKTYGYSGIYNVIVMQLLGKSLEDLFNMYKAFSLKTICMIGVQMVSVLEFIHNKHIVHRDMKPDNFVMGLDDLSQHVYLLDFGLAKKYRSSRTLEQYPLVNKKKLTGTARYASINALTGYEQSRRDDLEACGYVLIYLLKGRLPWQGLQAKSKGERYKKILDKKKDVTLEELCDGLPKEFERFITYTKGLEYTEEPNYEELKKLFRDIMARGKMNWDYVYEWTTKHEIRSRKDMTLRSEEDTNTHVRNGSTVKGYKGSNADKGNINERRNTHGNAKDQTVIYHTGTDGNLHTRVTTVAHNNNDNERRAREGDDDDKKCCTMF